MNYFKHSNGALIAFDDEQIDNVDLSELTEISELEALKEAIKSNEKPDLVLLQCNAIDEHIYSCIKTRDFDDIGQVALCCVDGNGYQIEALAVSAWVRKCWYIQEQIKSGEVKYDSVDDAIKALPPFDVSE